jgi:uncharacterized protein involved in exopolysaccharide biosynthesis
MRHPGLLLGLPILVSVAAAVVSLIVTPIYTSRAAFVPETRGAVTNLSPALLGLASQFGVNLGGDSGPGPWLYAELIRSRELGVRLLETRFPDPGAPGDSATYLDLLEIEGPTRERRIDDALVRLRSVIGVDVDVRTSIVHIGVDAEDAHLARQIATQLLTELNAFNLERRSTQAGARRAFIEERVHVADSMLRVAETDLESFLLRNRRFEDDPTLQFQEQRLRRRLTIQEELATTLRRDYESARIEEVNNTPLFTIVDPPSLPDRRSSPRRTLFVIVVFVAAMVGGVTVALAWETVRWVRRSNDPHIAEAEETVNRWLRRSSSRR